MRGIREIIRGKMRERLDEELTEEAIEEAIETVLDSQEKYWTTNDVIANWIENNINIDEMMGEEVDEVMQYYI